MGRKRTLGIAALAVLLLIAVALRVADPERSAVEPVRSPSERSASQTQAPVREPKSPASAPEAVEPVPGAARMPAAAAQPARPGDPQPLEQAELVIDVRELGSERLLTGCAVHVTPVVTRIHWPFDPGATESRGRVGDTLITDAQGLVRYELDPDTAYHVFVTDERGGHGIMRVPPLAAGEVRRVTYFLELDDTHIMGWRVVAVEDGRPLPGASVRVRSVAHGWLGSRDIVHEELVTDAEGRFELAVETQDNRFLQVQLPGYSELFCSLARREADTTEPVVLRLERAAAIEVLARDPAGAGLVGYTLRATTFPFHLVASSETVTTAKDPTFEAETDAAGRASIEVPAGAPLTVGLWFDGSEQARLADDLRLAPGHAESLEVVLGHGSTIRGIVVDQESRPVPRQHLWLVPDSPIASMGLSSARKPVDTTDTDGEGDFVFEDVQPGRWWVGLSPPGHMGPHKTHAAETVAVDVSAGSDPDSVTLLAHGGLFIRGVVVDPQGEPVIAGTVSAYRNATVLRDPVGVSGAFELGALLPGTYRVKANDSSGTYLQPIWLELEAGTEDVVIVLERGGHVSGVVYDVNGAAAKAKVYFVAETGEDRAHRKALPGDGTYSVGPLAAGTFSSVARLGETIGVERGIVVEAGVTRELDLHLEQGAVITVRHGADVGRASLRLVHDGLELGAATLVSGTTERFVVVPGRVDVTFREIARDAVEVVREVLAVSGSEHEVVFE